MNKIFCIFLSVVSMIAIVSCDGQGSPTVESIEIDESGLTLEGYALDDVLPDVTAIVSYSDGTADNRYTTQTIGDTSTFGHVTVVVSSVDDPAVTDSVEFTINNLAATIWNQTPSFTPVLLVFIDSSSYRGNDTWTYSVSDTTVTFTAGGFSSAVPDNFSDGEINTGMGIGYLQ